MSVCSGGASVSVRQGGEALLHRALGPRERVWAPYPSLGAGVAWACQAVMERREVELMHCEEGPP